MRVVYHEPLPESYLLIMATSPDDELETALNYCLYHASHSSRHAIWVDCALLEEMPPTAAKTLCLYHERLRQQHIRLVLVHLPESVEQELRRWNGTDSLCIVPTLLDAAKQPCID